MLEQRRGDFTGQKNAECIAARDKDNRQPAIFGIAIFLRQSRIRGQNAADTNAGEHARGCQYFFIGGKARRRHA